VTNQQTTKAPEPRERALDDPAVSVPTQQAVVFVLAMDAIGPIGNDDGEAASSKSLAQGVAVIGHVPDETAGLLARAAATTTRHADRLQRAFNQGHFTRAGRGDMYSQRNTRAVDHHHPLRTLTPLGFSDVRAPFFADANEPSMNTCSQRIRPRASSWPRNARHRRNHVPSSSHCRSRRQQVDPLGYPSGRSRQRAPVFNTQRIPSMTSRWLTRGRPPLRERRGRGRCGSILAHCASVSRTLRLATRTSGQGSTAAREKVQELILPFTRF
jgi:hypothetical protein